MTGATHFSFNMFYPIVAVTVMEQTDQPTMCLEVPESDCNSDQNNDSDENQNHFSKAETKNSGENSSRLRIRSPSQLYDFIREHTSNEEAKDEENHENIQAYLEKLKALVVYKEKGRSLMFNAN